MNYRRKIVEAKAWLSVYLALAMVVNVHWALTDTPWYWVVAAGFALWTACEIREAWAAHHSQDKEEA